MGLREDRDWLNNIREMQDVRERQKRTDHDRLIETHQEIIAEQAVATLPEELGNELDELERLALGQQIFESVGEDRWETLVEREGERLRDEGLRATERIPKTQEIVAQRMIEEAGRSQVETWARHAAGVAPA